MSEELHFGYRNHRGEYAPRRVIPISVRYGTSEYYQENGWLMLAHDLDRGAEREFSMRKMTFVDQRVLTIESTSIPKSALAATPEDIAASDTVIGPPCR